jgi:ketosteroid isomerase-like protein
VAEELGRESFENSAMDVERLVDAGDQVVSLIVMRATGRGSGVSVERKDAIVSTLQAGKITRIDWYNDQAQALEAAGLRE